MEPTKFGRYVLLERLAFGGMAEVLLAFDTEAQDNQPIVALKRILPNIAHDHNYIAMFIDEGRLLSQLRHKNIPRIFDMGNHGNIYFQSLEYVFGMSLRRLWEMVWQKQKFPIPLACFIVQKIATTLDFAHKKRGKDGASLGIIHRDVSPQNILVGYDGAIKVIDFGIAKAENRIASTQQGIIKGKVAYMAPEQALGQPFDHRIDIYALGLIFYELLTGQRAYKADSDFALLQQVRKGELNRRSMELEIIPDEVVAILEKAIHPKTKHRYQSGSDFAADLSKLITQKDWSSDREHLSLLAKQTFQETYRAHKQRLQNYTKQGKDGFGLHDDKDQAASIKSQETTQFTDSPLNTDQGVHSQTELNPISTNLSSNTDMHTQTSNEPIGSQSVEVGNVGVSDQMPSPPAENLNLKTPIKQQQMPTQSMAMLPNIIQPKRFSLITLTMTVVLSFALGFLSGSQLLPKPKTLAIATSPKGASVFCDNKPVCMETPCIFKDTCQSGKYIVQKERYFFESLRSTQFQTTSIIHLDLRPQLK